VGGGFTLVQPSIAANLCPCAYGWAEGLILSRDNRAEDDELVLDVDTDEELLEVGDLDFDATGGLRVGYGFRTHCGWGWEFGYLGVFDHSAKESVELDDGLMLPGDLGLQVNDFFEADEVDVKYSSDIHSFEANRVCCCCCSDGCCGRSVEWLAGFRFLSLDEEFSINADDFDEGESEYEVETKNRLYGGQVGTRLRRCRNRWSFETTAKAGLFGNDMEQQQDPIDDFPGFRFRDGEESHESDLAFVGDLNFSAIYQLNCVWGLRAGYNLIWIEGVALAPDQLDFDNGPDAGEGLEDGAGVLLHGFNFGAEARW
jgi:hypothetical protein